MKKNTKKETAKTQAYFGEVIKTFGINGELFAKLSDQIPDTFDMGEPLFIEIDGLDVPFYLNKFAPRGRKAVMIFDDMDTEALASELVGKKITYFTKVQTGSKKDEFDLSALIGFVINDSNYGNLGTVVEFYDFPGNPCMAIMQGEKEILIPIHHDLIVNFETDKKIINTKLPLGILDM